MSMVIGTIKTIIGQAWIVASDGTRRQATEGEQVMRGEQIVTEQGAVTVTLPNGKNLDLGRASHWGDDATVTTSAESAPPQDLAAAQQAIAEGADPSQVLEATAAGNPVTNNATGEAGDGGEGHTHVVLDLTGQILDPTAGYPTEGIDVTFPGPLEEETLLESDQNVNDTDDDPNITPEPPVPPTLPEASITIDVIAGDNIINMREAMQETTAVSGKTGHDVRPGDVVTVTVNGNHYQTTVQADGSWSMNVNTSDLLASGDVQASVTTRDDNGNEATATAQSGVGQATLSVEVEIEPIGGDGYLNNSELAQETTVLSGTSTAPAGTTVTLTINDQPVGTAVVDENGRWSTTVETAQIADGGSVQAAVTISDSFGNTVSDTAVTPVAPAPLAVEVTIDIIGEDGYLNNSELAQDTTVLSGTSTAPAGTTVTLTINDQPVGTAVVDENGRWSTTVETAQIADGGSVQAAVTLSDNYGNAVSDTAVTPVAPAPLAVEVTIDIIGEDGFLNNSELAQDTTVLSGTSTAPAGTTVTLTINDQPVGTAVVGENGRWSTTVETAQIADGGSVQAAVAISDNYGNAVSDTAVTPVAPAPLAVEVTIDIIGEDGYLNNSELAQETTVLSGTSTAPAGTTVTLTINDQPVGTAVVDENGRWSTTVETAQIADGGSVQAAVTISDSFGNTVSDTAVTPVAPAPLAVEVTIDIIGEDGYLNNSELAQETTVLSGTSTAPAGTTVTLTINGQPVGTAVVGENGRWSTVVETAQIADGGTVQAAVAITDNYGNAVSDTAVTPVAPAPLAVEVTIDIIGEDGYLNNSELAQDTTVLSGTSTAPAGTTVTLTINGHPIGTAVVGENGRWSTTVETAQIADGGSVQAAVAISDNYGNAVSDTAVTPVAPAPLAVEVTIDIIGEDGYLNNSELAQETTVLSGTSTAPAGTTVTLTINGQPVGTAVVGENGRWSTMVETAQIADGGSVQAAVAITDNYGNAVSDTAVTPVAPAPLAVEVTIDIIGEDGYLNNSELAQDTTALSGTSTAPAGTTVTLTINGQPIGTAVVGENGRWSTTVETAQIADGGSVQAAVAISDNYGNAVSDTAVTPVAPAPLAVEISIDPITGDNVLNFSDIDDATTTITGKVTGGASVGDVVTLSVDGHPYTGTLVQENGQLVYKIDVPTASLQSDSNLKIEASVTSSDKFGNTVSHSTDQGYTLEKGNVVEGTAKSDTPVTGTTGDSDIVLADVKGNIIQQGQDYNICFILDTSGSMKQNGVDRITPAKKAIYDVVKSLIESAGAGAGTVTIGLVTFAASASIKLTIDLSDPQALSKLQTTLNSINTSGNTDYYDAFNAAVTWFNAQTQGIENKTYFITDGAPNNTGSSNRYDEKTTKDAFDKLDAISDVEAIGIGSGVNATTLNKYDSNGESTTGIDPSDLASAIQGKEGVMDPGHDIVNAGAGNDIIFGDIATFASEEGTAVDLRSYITSEMGLSQSATDAQMHVWIAENQERLDGLLPESGGNDALFGGTGNDLIFGGGGDDLLVGGEGADTLYGGHGDDILIGDGANSLSELAGLFGSTELTAEQIADAIRNDVSKAGNLDGEGSADVLHGGAGDDLLFGGGGHDTLHGGAGDDLLIGGTGNDILTGGSGSDTFTWLKGDDGHDVIKDFNVAEGDRIDLSELLGEHIDNLDNFLQVTQDNSGNAVIEINTNGQISNGANMSITVEGCSAADINSLLANPDNTAIII